MSVEKVKAYFETLDKKYEIVEFDQAIRTVEEAAAGVGVEPERIAKTLAYKSDEGAVVVVASGEAKVDNNKYKKQFGKRARMLNPCELTELLDCEPGGVSPFAADHPGVEVYIDISLKRFGEDKIYPSAGSCNSAVGMTVQELFYVADSRGWVDVCKGWQPEDVSE